MFTEEIYYENLTTEEARHTDEAYEQLQSLLGIVQYEID